MEIPNDIKNNYRLIPRKKLLFQIHLVNHCNLNCISCAHYAPLADQKYLDVEIFRSDMKRLSLLSNGEIELIDLMGGEPLLHPAVEEIMHISRDNFHGEIRIITNGILLLNQSIDFWETCRMDDITIVLSRYPINIDLNVIKQLVQQYNIKFVVRAEYGEFKNWFRNHLDIKGTQEVYNNFEKCNNANRTIFLQNGKLATCGAPFLIKHFNEYFQQNLTVTDKDYIDIYNAKNLHQILTFLSNPIPFCRYCMPDNIRIKWERSKRNILEWI
jgi:organic radical activating enzyme